MNKFLSITKTWRDKVNGNTYFSSRVYDGNLDAPCIVLPMQCGYENASESAVYKKLYNIMETGFDIEFIKIEHQKKKDVKNWGIVGAWEEDVQKFLEETK